MTRVETASIVVFPGLLSLKLSNIVQYIIRLDECGFSCFTLTESGRWSEFIYE